MPNIMHALIALKVTNIFGLIIINLIMDRIEKIIDQLEKINSR
jgi:hypothetical protein